MSKLNDSDYLEPQFAHDPRLMSRRSFLTQTALLTGAVGLGMGLNTSPLLAQTPSKGGFARFAFGRGATTDTLDPARRLIVYLQSGFGGSMCNNLTEILSDGTIAPDLAESFEASDGAKKWVFKLRKGVTFHNGKSVTTEDVRQSFFHHMGENSGSGARSLLTQIDSIEADGPDTVVFTLKSGNADFAYLIADGHLSVLPAKDSGGIDWESGVGTGGFTLESFEPGVSLKMKRNPNYYKDNRPYLDEFEYVVIADATAAINALSTGEIDYINDVPMKNLSILGRNSDIDVLRVPSLRHFTFDMDTTTAPFNDPNVRMAFKHAIDREDIIRKVYLGEARPGNDSPIAESMQYYADPAPRHAYDPEKAKAYLKAAGLDSLKVDLSVAEAGFVGSVDTAVLFKEHAAKAGIEINVVREADDGYYSKVFMKKPFNCCSWLGRATCDWMLSSAYETGASYNNTHWSNAKFDEGLKAARSETDQTMRAAQYKDLQQLIHDDCGAIVIAFVNWTSALSKKLAHGDVGGIMACDNLRMTERWWAA